MPSTYSNLKIELIGTGEQVGTWGESTNSNLGNAIDEAISGTTNVTFSNANVVLTLVNSSASQPARNMRLNLVGVASTPLTLTVPAIQKLYLITNNLASAITVQNSTGTGASVPAGKSVWVYNDSANVSYGINSLGATLAVNAGGTGTTTSTGTGSVVLNTSPSLVTPLLGTPTSGTLTNCTGLPLTSGAGVTGVLPVLNGGTGVTTSTGSGSNVLSTSPALTTPNLGTPSAGTLTNCTGLPGSTGIVGDAGSAGKVLQSTGTGNAVWALGAYQGITDYTVTSTVNTFTLTYTSNQIVRLVNDATTATATVAITLPAMNSNMSAGWGKFIFQNDTLQGYIIALKDAGGTTRQYVSGTGGSTQGLTIKDISTANGTWYVHDYYSIVAGLRNISSATSVLTNAGYTIQATALIPLTSTSFAIVWTEVDSNAGIGVQANAAIYAQHYTINTATNVVTTSNKVTIQALGSTVAMGYNYINWDVDQNGHAFVMISGELGSASCCGSNWSRMGAGWFGLSSSGGTLYASAVTVVGQVYNAFGSNFYAQPLYVSYLGSNNAYAFSFSYPTSGSNASVVYFGGATVTGTTAVTLTNSASNISVALGNLGTTWSSLPAYSSRTSLTTFTAGGPANGTIPLWGRAISYTPASNTFTQVARTTATRLTIEQASSAAYASFGQGGFMYCVNKVIYGGFSWTIANAGAAGVSSTLNGTITAKSFGSSVYSSVTSAPTAVLASARSVFISGTTLNAGYFTCDTTAADFNLNGQFGSGSIGGMISTANSISLVSWGTSGSSFTINGIATPFSPL